MKKLSSLTIFFPTKNDQDTIGGLVKKAYLIGKSVTDNLEIIVVDDGSDDNTNLVLQKLQKRFPRLKIVTHKKNLGYGAALREGFSSASKDWVFYTDGDGQYDLSQLKLLVEKVNPRIDIVNGYKAQRSDSSIRILLGHIYRKILKRIYNLPIRDVDCDFRLIRQSYMKKIRLSSSSGIICLELVVKLTAVGARFAEVSVSHYKRQFGRSQFFTVGNIIKTARDHFFFYFTYKKGTI